MSQGRRGSGGGLAARLDQVHRAATQDRRAHRLPMRGRPKRLSRDARGASPRDRLAAPCLVPLVSRRSRKASLVLTSPPRYGAGGEGLADPGPAAALLDRRVPHSTTGTSRGPSSRRRETRVKMARATP